MICTMLMQAFSPCPHHGDDHPRPCRADGVISFVFNAALLALTVNIASAI
jgi:hypothetical protein